MCCYIIIEPLKKGKKNVAIVLFESNLTPFTVDAGQDPVYVESITKTMVGCLYKRFP